MSTDTTMNSTLQGTRRPPGYEQFLLFGDSITQMSYDQQLGFGFGAALQNGKCMPQDQDVHKQCILSNGVQHLFDVWM
jgi:hypothetical protein